MFFSNFFIFLGSGLVIHYSVDALSSVQVLGIDLADDDLL